MKKSYFIYLLSFLFLLWANESLSWKIMDTEGSFGDYDCLQISYLSDEEYNEKLERLQRKISFNPASREYLGLARLYKCRGDMKKAEENYIWATKYNREEDPEIDFNLAVFYERVYHQYEDANKIHLKIVEKNPYYLKSFNSLGNNYLALGKYEKSIECFEYYLKFDKYWFGAYTGVVLNYFGLGEDEKALKYLEKLKDIDPGKERLFEQYFWYFLREEKLDDAYKQIQKLLSLKEYYSIYAVFNLEFIQSYYYIKVGDIKEAAKHLENYLKLVTDSHYSFAPVEEEKIERTRIHLNFLKNKTQIELKELLEKAGFSFKKDDYKEAIAYYYLAYILEPKNKEIIKNLGMCYLEINELRSARFYLERYLKMDPTGEYAEEVQQWIDVIKEMD